MTEKVQKQSKVYQKKETKREGPEERDLQTLFEGKIPEEKGKENSENGTVVTEPERIIFQLTSSTEIEIS